MNDIKKAIATIGNMIGFDKEEVVEKLQEWNKKKIYPVSVVDIKISAGGVTDNSKEVGEIVDVIGKYVDDVVKNTLDAESVIDAKKTVAEVGKFLIETRKIQTNPLKEVAAHFTKHESKFKDYNEAFIAKFEAINEIEYQKKDKSITAHFKELIKSDNLTGVVSIDVFKDFIKNKRKTAIYTSTGNLSKPIKDAISEALRLVSEPIKKAKDLEVKKEQQSKQFEGYLENIVADGKTNVLESSIISLVRMDETVDEYYPDVAESCHRSIANKKARCEANIRANKAISEADAVKNADADSMLLFDAISLKTKDMSIGIDVLTAYANQLREIYPKLKLAENQDKIKALGVSLKQRIVDLEVVENTPVIQPKKIVSDVILEDPDKSKYFISINDLEFLASVGVEADSENEAKKKFVTMFESHLSMVQLSKGK